MGFAQRGEGPATVALLDLSPGGPVGIILAPKRSFLMRRALTAALVSMLFLLPACNLTSQARVDSIKQMNEGITQLNKNNVSGAERAMMDDAYAQMMALMRELEIRPPKQDPDQLMRPN